MCADLTNFAPSFKHIRHENNHLYYFSVCIAFFYTEEDRFSVIGFLTPPVGKSGESKQIIAEVDIPCSGQLEMGAGLLCIQGTSFSFIGPIIATGLVGGLPLIFGSCMAAALMYSIN